MGVRSVIFNFWVEPFAVAPNCSLSHPSGAGREPGNSSLMTRGCAPPSPAASRPEGGGIIFDRRLPFVATPRPRLLMHQHQQSVDPTEAREAPRRRRGYPRAVGRRARAARSAPEAHPSLLQAGFGVGVLKKGWLNPALCLNGICLSAGAVVPPRACLDGGGFRQCARTSKVGFWDVTCRAAGSLSGCGDRIGEIGRLGLVLGGRFPVARVVVGAKIGVVWFSAFDFLG